MSISSIYPPGSPFDVQPQVNIHSLRDYAVLDSDGSWWNRGRPTSYQVREVQEPMSVGRQTFKRERERERNCCRVMAQTKLLMPQ